MKQHPTAMHLLAHDLELKKARIAELEAQLAALQSAPVTPAQDAQEAFTEWAQVKYRNADEYTTRDFAMGLDAWTEQVSRAALSQQDSGDAEDAAMLNWLLTNEGDIQICFFNEAGDWREYFLTPEAIKDEIRAARQVPNKEKSHE